MKISKKRIAAIDIGTNSFHLIIAEQKHKNSFRLLDSEREFVRLGADSPPDKTIISEEDIKKAVTVLTRFAALAKYHKADIATVATSAVRESLNKDQFIQAIKVQTGIDVKVINGNEEARLIFLGMKNAIHIKDKSILGIDIGGGSTEFIHSVNDKIVFAESVKIGAVRLSKMFFDYFIITDEAVRNCSDYVEKKLKENSNIKLEIDLDFAIGSSGTVDTICMIKQLEKDGIAKHRLNGFSFTRDEFFEVYDLIMKCKTVEERIRIPGIELKRADIIPAGLIILKKSFELFNIKKMVLSEYALREGIIFNSFN